MSIAQGTIALLVRNGIKIAATLAQNVLDVLRGRRYPFCALPGEDVLEIHGVDLFEGAALAFNDEEVDDKRTQKVAASKNITISIIKKLEKRCNCS